MKEEDHDVVTIIDGDLNNDDSSNSAEEEEECSDWVLLGLCLLNASAYLGMMLAKAWAGLSHDATALDFASPLTPAPWVAARVWDAITLALLLVFLLWPFLPWLSPARKRDVVRVSQPFVLACASHAMWSVLWSYGFLALSALLSATVCVQLMAASLALARSPPLFRLPFGLWLGWEAFATLSQASAALYHEAGLAFFGSAWWSAAAMLSLTAVAYTWGSMADDPFFSAALAAALFGVTQLHHSLVVSRVAYTCCVALTAHALIVCLTNFDAARREQAPADGDDDGSDEDAYECEEAALLLAAGDEDGGAQQHQQQPRLASAPLLSLPIEDSLPLYPTTLYVARPPMAAAAEEFGQYHQYYYPSYSAYHHPAAATIEPARRTRQLRRPSSTRASPPSSPIPLPHSLPPRSEEAFLQHCIPHTPTYQSICTYQHSEPAFLAYLLLCYLHG
ncbi:uncharacterized protein ACA1_101430 [Acanthamoeba castellanii str. Neff]|uniref:Uncharacterized protein n=1 Tax=Acanthamoeba castellanii (strain ATCC 30010 / Neff) TaxID=1257118 RepID=L8GGK9_ACACF|nr:uncharacterized protein ACA1_101430 [Acanthamoeba castellanii str. Neff]ELR12082.1 hypothetical protein ACA1_101430 [Acanthamoeba castellanii str. Neff]